ncbi:hypothetical protein D3C77_318530 [compost metagenome]
MDANLQLFQNLINTNPQVAALLNQLKPAQVPEPEKARPHEDLTQEQQFKLLYVIYKEFLEEEDGKQLAASIGKFARFAQSRADRK